LRTDDGLLIRPDRKEVEPKFHRPDLFFMPPASVRERREMDVPGEAATPNEIQFSGTA
jgi:hypothetical protein